MSGLATSIGLISGIDIGNLVNQLIALQRLPAARMEQRVKALQATQTGWGTLEANLLTLSTSITALKTRSTFSAFKANNSDKAQLSVQTQSNAVPGTYQLQALRTAATHEAVSKGFANSDQQPVGAGTLTLATGGWLERPTLLSALNGGAGVRRGTIRITDRSGNSADIDLSAAYSVTDVLDAINTQSGISVAAWAEGDHLVLADTTGATASNLTVVDVNGGHAAGDLGIAGSVAAAKLVGSAVHTLTGDYTLDQINDGNRLRLLKAAGAEDEDVVITLSDGTVLDIDLDSAVNLNDVLGLFNGHMNNGGKLTAALVGGRLQLTDNSGGGGSFSIADANGAAVVAALGLDKAAVGNQIVGDRLLAGINSVLLRNLRGGQGITEVGQLTLQNRSGTTAVIDLSGAESLDEILAAINAAEDGQGTKLLLTARINAVGTGIEIVDSSGGAGNLVIADAGGGTLAQELGIAVNAGVNSVNSGSLAHRYINQASLLRDYLNGGSLAEGSFTITNSAGATVTVTIGTTAVTVGDVLQRINAATSAAGFNVAARLNDTGDGFVLVDTAGGAGTLRVAELGGKTAAQLKILGTGATVGGTQQISGRAATIVAIDADDTLEDLAEKINAGGPARAAIVNDGSAFNSARLSLRAKSSGAANRLVIDDGGLGLHFQTQVAGQDALLRVGGSPANGFLLASATNTFKNAVAGIDITVLEPASKPAEVSVSANAARIQDALQNFVNGYNKFVDAVAELTRFNPRTNERGVLQGDGVVLRVMQRLESLINRRSLSAADAVRSLADLGVRAAAGGKLALDVDRLMAVVEQHPQAVGDFFLINDSGDPADFGFAELADRTLTSLTDPFTGALVLQRNALQDSVEALQTRVAQLDEILQARRQRLIRQFINMENALGTLTSQQQAIAGIAPLRINRLGNKE